MPTTIPVASIALMSPPMGVRDNLLAIVCNRDLIAISIFSAAGLLLTILLSYYVITRFPDLGALIEQYNQF
jgi:hypothetical protein